MTDPTAVEKTLLANQTAIIALLVVLIKKEHEKPLVDFTSMDELVKACEANVRKVLGL